jgi:hypothetical protein
MADTYTAASKARLIEDQTRDGTWGPILNAGTLELIDDMASGMSAINLGTSTTYAMAALSNGTDSESRAAHLRFTGTPASAVTITVPASVVDKYYRVENSTGQRLTIKYAASTGVVLGNLDKCVVWCNGTEIYDQGPGSRITAAEIAASVTPTGFVPVLIPDIERYGASTGASAATNTTAIQSGINANYGGCLKIPKGTYQVATTGSTTAPVGSALTITDEITLIFEGTLEATNNCNIININAGAQDVVKLVGMGGMKGYGTFFETTNYNGANVLVTAGILRLGDGVVLTDPPQYGVRAMNCAEGEMSDFWIVGGKTTYPGDNNYGVCLIDGSTDWKIINGKFKANGSGGMCSQGVASLYNMVVAAYAHRPIIQDCRFQTWEKATYMINDDTTLTGNVARGMTEGEGFRMVGARTLATGNKVGSVVSANEVYDSAGAAFTLSYYSAVGSASLSYAKFIGNTVIGKTSGSTNVASFDVRGHSSTSTTEAGIEIVGNTVLNGNYSSAEDRAAFDILPQSAAFRDLRIEHNSSYKSGSRGFRFQAGNYYYTRFNHNKAIDPGMFSSTFGSGRPGVRWDGSVTWVGGSISHNEARSEHASSGMTYGFDNNTESGIQSTKILHNHSRGHTQSTGIGGMQHSSNTREGNGNGDNSLHGTLSCTAVASFVISNSNATSGMRISIYPTNAAAVALQAGVDALYWDGTVTIGTSFTLKTGGGGNAAGTETFEWKIEV